LTEGSETRRKVGGVSKEEKMKEPGQRGKAMTS